MTCISNDIGFQTFNKLLECQSSKVMHGSREALYPTAVMTLSSRGVETVAKRHMTRISL